MRDSGLVGLVVFFLMVAGTSACTSGSEESEGGEVEFAQTRGEDLDFGETDERVRIIEPKDGATVTSPVVVKTEHEGLILRSPAFQGEKARYGHLHLLIDVPTPPAGEVIPNDEQHLHYHNQETEPAVNLSPGQHTITLVFGSSASRVSDPPITDTISVNVSDAQEIFFIEPSDPDIREFPFTVKAGSKGLDISKGHFVVVVDVYPFPKEGEPVPVDENHFHFETGATELEMNLEVGGAIINLLFVDENNRLLPGPTLSDKMDIAIWKPVKLEKIAAFPR